MPEPIDNPHVALNNARNLPREGESTLRRFQIAQPPKFKISIDVEAEKEAVVTEFAIKFLRDRGYHVAEPNARWERKIDFMKRLRIANHTSVLRYIDQWEARGHKIPVRTGPTGSLRELRSNSEFDAFCKS